jgi:ferredoxin
MSPLTPAQFDQLRRPGEELTIMADEESTGMANQPSMGMATPSMQPEMMQHESNGVGHLYIQTNETRNVTVRWSCRTGVCHNCETTLISGTVDYNPDPVEPPADGSALICCSRLHDDVVLDL